MNTPQENINESKIGFPTSVKLLYVCSFLLLLVCVALPFVVQPIPQVDTSGAVMSMEEAVEIINYYYEIGVVK